MPNTTAFLSASSLALKLRSLPCSPCFFQATLSSHIVFLQEHSSKHVHTSGKRCSLHAYAEPSNFSSLNDKVSLENILFSKTKLQKKKKRKNREKEKNRNASLFYTCNVLWQAVEPLVNLTNLPVIFALSRYLGTRWLYFYSQAIYFLWFYILASYFLPLPRMNI